MSTKFDDCLESLRSTYDSLPTLPEDKPIFVGATDQLLENSERLMRRLQYFGRLLIFKRRTQQKLRELKREHLRLMNEITMVNACIEDEQENLKKVKLDEVAQSEVNQLSSPDELPLAQEDVFSPVFLSSSDES